MRTETITYGGATAVVRSANRRTTIIEKEYQRMLMDVCPEIMDLLRENLSVPYFKMVKRPDDDGKMIDVADETDMQRYIMQLSQVSTRYPVAAEHFEKMNEFILLAARLISVTGLPFNVESNQRFNKDNIIIAYEYSLEAESLDEGFWGEVRRGIQTVDAPLTPLEQQPLEALSVAESAIPFSKKDMRSGNVA